MKVKIIVTEFFRGGYCAETDKGIRLVNKAKTQETCVNLAISKARKCFAEIVKSGDIIEVYERPPSYSKRPERLLKQVTI